ncbi:ATP-binding protein [Streptomyces cellostaticus]|uniref:ATP-binding protein n=1 Tax=Streptomyces cellostaticus TaxID=67285 RepID=UPI00202624FC|nr:ATP-binding protein [Streptomyces cellostaticus]
MAIPLVQKAPDGPEWNGDASPRWSATWDSGAITAARARAAAESFLDRVRATGRIPVPDLVVQDALLVVSELITNVVLHTSGPCGLGLEVAPDGDRLRISVWDSSGRMPEVRSRDARRVGGHGLEIVKAIGHTLSVRARDEGKRVEVSLLLPGARGPAPQAEPDPDPLRRAPRERIRADPPNGPPGSRTAAPPGRTAPPTRALRAARDGRRAPARRCRAA